ncbi:ECF RNA polymerase sigma factor SigK [Actinoplanes sp. M2I2]|uniref:ECF RNA polymerase sigma factor SigK n=1 Tax=Actinoplanes sp. M2I2 TaxID=1734444 RepID=UPI0027DF7E6D|nr:ECF RNA polymerase sigma factor SigK [Actinoplanes sp. M2I2]
MDGFDAGALMGAVARGDEAAFGRLYAVIAPRVYGLAVGVLRDWALAEEVTQDVIAEVWCTAGRFDGARGSALGWVLTIARRRSVDRVRAEQAHTNRLVKAGVASAGIAYDQVAEAIDDRVRHRQVRSCLECLTDLQRQALLLAYYRGHSCREVADLLHVALPTVKTRMRDGLIRLRDCLGSGHEPVVPSARIGPRQRPRLAATR